MSKNHIWVEFEEKNFFQNFFLFFQNYPYDFTLICPKIIEALVGTPNFLHFSKLYTMWLPKKMDIVAGFCRYG